MPTNITKSSFDTHTSEEFPNGNHGDWRRFFLRDEAGRRLLGYIFFAGIPPQGSTVASATLRLWLRGAGWSGGPHTLTAKRINAGWKESKLTWNRSGAGQMADATNAASIQITDGAHRDEVSLDVSAMLADVAAGQPWYGIRLEATGGLKELYPSETSLSAFRPQLEVAWSTAPDAPNDLSPSGGAVSVSNPTLTWSYRDRDGDEQAELQVQISTTDTTNPDGSLASPEHDSGFVVSGDEQYDTSQGASRTASVTTTSASTTITAAVATFEDADVGASITGTGIPAGTTIATVVSPTEATMSQAATASGTITATITRTFAGLADGATRFWVVRVQDINGRTSDWSDVAEFSRAIKGTFVIDSPLDGGTVDETTPPITTTLTGRAQESIQYVLWEDDGTGRLVPVWLARRFEAPAADGVAFSFAVPAGRIKRTGRDYLIEVKAWDTVDRVGTPGDPTLVFASATFTFVRSATPSPVTSLTVVEDQPGVKLTFNRGAGVAAPDYFALVIDGVRVFDRIDPVEFSQGGDPIVYEFVYYGAVPKIGHTFEVEAVVNDAGKLKHSQGNATQNFTPEVGGVWLVDDDDPPHPSASLPRKVRIRGGEEPDLQIGESSAVFYPIGRRDPVRIVDAIRGLEGSVSGILDADDPFGPDFIENFRWMKDPERVGQRFRLIFGSENLPVELGQASFAYDDAAPEQRRYAVSVEVAQVDGFE